jgi:aminoglycoside phosphotransferase (APT) family kinase protein
VPAREWSAEVAIDAALVRRVLGEQFAELELGTVRLLGEGWDNSVWLVDERWVFRFPRREIAVPAVERQVALLPRLAPYLPLPIPQPVFAGRPGEDFGWPFFGTPFLSGSEAADISLTDDARTRAARPLAEFLRALHAPELLELDGVEALPVDPMGRADMAFRVPRTRDRLDELREHGLWEAPAQVEELLEPAERLPLPSGLAVAHGDLHLRHLLVADDGVPTAVIDWDDLCRGDPAIDLMPVWSHLPPAARPAFLAAYGPVRDDQLVRARVLALFLCGSLAVYAHHEGVEGLKREALAGLARAATE